MKNLYMMAALVAACVSVSSCTESSQIGEPIETNKSIAFDTYLNQTRASQSTITELQNDGFSVWISQQKENDYDKTQDDCDYLYDEPVTYNAGVWEYINKRFWMGTKRYSFFALSPRASTTLAVNDGHAVGSKGAPAFTYTMPTLFADQVDILADNLIEQTQTDEVTFDFEHMLSCISFQVQIDPNQVLATTSTVQLNKLEVFYKENGLKNKCIIDLNDVSSTVDATSYATTSGELSAGVWYEDATGIQITATAARAAAADQYMMVPPQVYAEGDLFVRVTYTYRVDDTDHYPVGNVDGQVEVVTTDFALPVPKDESGADLPYEKGKHYIYMLHPDLQSLSMNGTISVEPWTAPEDVAANLPI